MLRHRSLHPLSHQHHNGLALCVLSARSLESDSSAENVARLCRKAADRFDLELVNHFELEEQELFPAIRAEFGPSPLVDRLVEEHRRLEQLALRLKHEPSLETLREFLALLRAHIRCEEEELFESVQNRLSEATMERLGAEFEARAVRICIEP
jgi:hemerythrin-like domain-containing protein